jgi:hypothetical protein
MKVFFATISHVNATVLAPTDLMKERKRQLICIRKLCGRVVYQVCQWASYAAHLFEDPVPNRVESSSSRATAVCASLPNIMKVDLVMHILYKCNMVKKYSKIILMMQLKEPKSTFLGFSRTCILVNQSQPDTYIYTHIMPLIQKMTRRQRLAK